MEIASFPQHSNEELIKVYFQLKGDDEFANYFIEYYSTAFNDYSNEPDEGEAPMEMALDLVVNTYFPIFLDQLKKGHSAKWAHEYAISSEEGDQLIYDTFQIIKKIDQLWAQNELIVHCKSFGITDPIQVNKFIFLMDGPYGEGFIDGTQKAQLYFENFNKAIAKNKSVLYAHIYAEEQSTDEYRDSYCDASAWAFEQCVKFNKPESFRNSFVDMFSERIANQYSDFEEALNDEIFYYYVNPLIAECQAREYCHRNKIDKPDSFILTYVNKFENYYADQELKLQSVEKDIDEIILEKSLLK